MGAWDDVATSFTQTRQKLGSLDRPAPVVRREPVRRASQPRPRAAVPRARPAPSRQRPREQITDDEIKALTELQTRGAQLGVDTTQLDPKPDQKVGDFIRDVNTVFDDADKTLLEMAQAEAEARIADPGEQIAPFTAAAGQTPAGPDSPLARILRLSDVTEPIIDPEFAERQGRRLPGIAGDIAGPVLGAGAEITTPLDIAAMLLAAGVGGVAAAGLRTLGKTGRIAGGLVDRLASTFPRALAAEAALGTGFVLGATEGAEALQDAPAPIRVAGTIGAGLAAGVLTLKSPAAGRKLLKESARVLAAGGRAAEAVGRTNIGNVLLPAAEDARVLAMVDEIAGKPKLARFNEILTERLETEPLQKFDDQFPNAREDRVSKQVGRELTPEFEAARTGQPFDAVLFRGFDRKDIRSVFSDLNVEGNVLGEGTYTTPSAIHAANFGETIEELRITLKNPLVISTGDEWRALTRAAGLKFPKGFEAGRAQKIRTYIESQGHDGVIIRTGDDLVNDVFGTTDTVLDFSEIRPDVLDARGQVSPAPAVRQIEPGIITPETTAQRTTATREILDANDIPSDPETLALVTANAELRIAEAVPAVDKIKAFLDVAGKATKKAAGETAALRRQGVAEGIRRAKGVLDPAKALRLFRGGQAGLRRGRQVFDPIIDPDTKIVQGIPDDVSHLAPTEASLATGIDSADLKSLYDAIAAKWPLDSGLGFTNGHAQEALTKVLLGDVPAPAEIKLLKQVFGDSWVKQLLARRPGRVGDIAFDLFFLVGKTLRSSMDASAIFRQLVIFTLQPRRIKQTARTMERMFRVGFTRGDSQLMANQFNDELVNPVKNRHATRLLDPEAERQIQLHDISESGVLQFTDKEEVFSSSLTAMLPKLGKDVRSVFGRRLPKPVTFGIKATLLPVRIVGSAIRRSELMYATAINQMRMRVAGATLDNWDEVARLTGQPVERESIDVLIDGVNVFTGRGHLGPLGGERRSRLLNAIFWAPKLAISRFQAPLIGARGLAELSLTGVAKVTRADPESLLSRVANSPGARARKELAKDLVAFVGTGAAILGALDAFGIAEVETDPRSSDFGKGKFGDIRVDFWGGFQQPARYVWQAATGTQIRLSGPDKGELIRLGSFFATLEEEEARAAGVGRTRRGPKSEPKPVPPPERLDLLWRFLQSKVAPGVTALTVNELRGQTFIGDVITEPAPVFGQDIGFTTDVRTREAIQQLIPLFAIDIIEAIESQGVGRGMAFGVGAALGVGIQTFGEEGTGRFDEEKPAELRRSALPSAEDNWNRVSELMDQGDLVALQKVWDGRVISRSESTSLRKVFREEPLGQSNFRTWMKQTLRQVQENAAVASRMRESQEFVTV